MTMIALLIALIALMFASVFMGLPTLAGLSLMAVLVLLGTSEGQSKGNG